MERQRRRKIDWGHLASTSSVHKQIYVHVDDTYRHGTIGVRGEAGTPYEKGLIFFDVVLSERHPFEAPVVTVHPMSRDIPHPLLSGSRIQVPLVSSISARNEDKWQPTNRLERIGAVLVGLFTANPYAIQRPGITPNHPLSTSYDKAIRCAILRNISRLDQNPPAGFEGIIKTHILENRQWFEEGCLRENITGLFQRPETPIIEIQCIGVRAEPHEIYIPETPPQLTESVEASVPPIHTKKIIKKPGRKSPTSPAREFETGYECVSENDGRRWRVVPRGRGVCWVLCKA